MNRLERIAAIAGWTLIIGGLAATAIGYGFETWGR